MVGAANLAVGDMLPEVRGTVTQETINAYAEVSGDYNPLHVDPEFARTTEFGGTIAHGPLALCFIFQLLTRHLPQGWPARSNVRATYLGPVRPGDQIVARGRVVSRQDTGEGIQLRVDATCENQRGEKILAATADVICPVTR